MKLVVMLVVVLAASGVFMQIVGAVATSAFALRHRTRKDRPARIEPAAHLRSRIVNSAVSTGLVFLVTIGLRSYLFVDYPVSALRTVGEAAAILALYDFGYYLLHRFAFHGSALGRRIHAVHHTVRTPYAVDSLYIHPAETAAGVALFLLSAFVVGPIGMWTFGLAFLVYSVVNLFIHSAVDLPFFPFHWATALVRHHDIHHESMKSGYYASMTPVWDLVFGTARRPD